MYDYLVKVILLGPSGAGKSVLSLFYQTITTLQPIPNRFSIPQLQILPPAPLPQKRMAHPLLPNHWCRIRLQDHQNRHRRTTKEDKTATVGYGGYGAVQVGIEVLLSRRCRRHLGL